MNQTKFEFNGITFRIHYSFPAAISESKNPCRALVTPLHPADGKAITKKQLYNKNSDYPVEYPIYGRNRQDIYNRLVPDAAQDLYCQMQQSGLIAPSQIQKSKDLASWAVDFEHIFFDLHRDGWKRNTLAAYQGQYRLLVPCLQGIYPEEVTQAVYGDLQNNICKNALCTTRKDREEWMPGMQPPSSAAKRLTLLYDLLWDLKRVAGLDIPATPYRYGGKVSRTTLLLVRTDNARSLPPQCVDILLSHPDLRLQPALLIDCGLRISENAGLLWDSLHRINGSQGPLYYLTVTGQLSPDGVRTEYAKSDSAYRILPVSPDLGRDLSNRKADLETRNGNIDLTLMCLPAPQTTVECAAQAARDYKNHVTDLIPTLLRQPDCFNAVTQQHPYDFSASKQNDLLYSMLTCHSLRRNYCTYLYSSGISPQDIFYLMGHSVRKSHYKASSKTPEEIYRLCLALYVRRTPFHMPQPLRYALGAALRQSEVPACEVELSVPAGSAWELIVEDTEPDNALQIDTTSVQVQMLRSDSILSTDFSDSLLVRDDLTHILSIDYPFRSEGSDVT